MSPLFHSLASLSLRTRTAASSSSKCKIISTNIGSWTSFKVWWQLFYELWLGAGPVLMHAHCRTQTRANRTPHSHRRAAQVHIAARSPVVREGFSRAGPELRTYCHMALAERIVAEAQIIVEALYDRISHCKGALKKRRGIYRKISKSRFIFH